jgi:hypothetical protein
MAFFTGIFYLRFMDDIIILVKNKRQYIKARKRLFAVLKALRLKISPHKTRMGALKEGFHFLGVNFEVARTPQGEIQEAKLRCIARTCRRALDKVVALRSNAVILRKFRATYQDGQPGGNRQVGKINCSCLLVGCDIRMQLNKWQMRGLAEDCY